MGRTDAFEALMRAQIEALKFQRPMFEAFGGSGPMTDEDRTAFRDSATRQMKTMQTAWANWSAAVKDSTEANPSGGPVGAGWSGLRGYFDGLAQGPDFADLGLGDKNLLQASREWAALQEALQAYQTVLAGAWARAAVRFAKDYAGKSDLTNAGFKVLQDHWLETANAELIQCQRSDAFLKAQRAVMSAGVAYKHRERSVVEDWCERNTIPTRTEVDDLHKIVDHLSREVRDLRKRLQHDGTDQRAPRRKPK